MKKINDKLLIERYLQGTLSQQEEEAFEEALVSSPELLDQLETAEHLRQGMKDLAAVEGLKLSGSGEAAVVPLFNSPRYALAATVFLAVSLVFTGKLYMQNLELTANTSVGEAVPTLMVELNSVRGAAGSSPNTIELGEAGEHLVLLLDPGYETYSHYRATLARLDEGRSADTVWQLDKMQPGYLDTLALGLPSDLLSPGDYEVRVEGWRSEWPANREYEPINRYTFRVP